MKQRLTFPKKVHVTFLMSVAILFILNGCFTTTSDPTPSSSGSGSSGNTAKPAPTATFTFSIGQSGNVTFTNLSVNATIYTWEFGDQTINSAQENPVHQYATNGTFTVSLTATGAGGTKTTTSRITISNVLGTITYKNTTQEKITITINGQTQVVAPDASVVFSGPPNTSATGTGVTFGATSSGTQIGLKLTFNFNDTFTSPGTTSNLTISSGYFYLKVKNSWLYPITKVYVNYGLTGQTQDNITIPNDSQIYGLGYYSNPATPNVRVENGTHFWSSNIFPDITNNSVATLEVK